MEKIIYKNKEEAEVAVAAFVDALSKLHDKYSVEQEIDDSCVGCWFVAYYYDENGCIKKYYS